MARKIKLRTIERKQIDEDKLALAFWLLAKGLQEQKTVCEANEIAPSWPGEQSEAV